MSTSRIRVVQAEHCPLIRGAVCGAILHRGPLAVVGVGSGHAAVGARDELVVGVVGEGIVALGDHLNVGVGCDVQIANPKPV